MSGEDLSSAQCAPEPRAPLDPADLTVARLLDLGGRVAQRTWAHGVRRWFWGEGVALLGLGRFGQVAASGDDTRVRQWVGEHLATGITVEHVNNLAPGAAAVVVDREGRFRAALRPQAQWVMEDPAASRAPNGALEHWPGGVWADTMFMAGAFLAQYGRATRDPVLVEEAGRQFLRHAELLQHDGSGLFAHGSYRGETIWCFWGRANAWAALAAVEFLEASVDLPVVEGRLRTEVAERLARQLTTLARLQPGHGVWDVLVDGQVETRGIVETSAAAGLAAAMLRAGEVVAGLPPAVVEAGWRAVRGTLAYVDADGTLTRVSAGTVLQLVPFGYSVIRDDRLQLWGQGLALHAIVAALHHPPIGVGGGGV
ncbi:MAG: glycoside hydrolase family 88 protein [Actinomycetes bacterium]